jgi:hypothetical protein
MDQQANRRQNMTKAIETVQSNAAPKRKMMTFREFVEFRKKFGDQAIKRLVSRKEIKINIKKLE